MGYPSDISEEEWELIKEHFNTGNSGKSRKYGQHSLVNAVLYIVKTECQWRQLPKEFSNYKTVFSFYKRAKAAGIWGKMMKTLVEKSRLNQGQCNTKV